MLFQTPTSSVDWLIAGLGNPGQKYTNTRHNMGFLAVDLLAEQQHVKLNKVKFQSAYNLLQFAGARCLVMKPQTYMNLSGAAVGEAARFYKIPADHILVIHDDVDLAVGRLRLRPSGSAGGHNGIKSIISHLGTQEFPRIKVGVGDPGNPGEPERDMVSWVIGAPSQAEKKLLLESITRAVQAAETILKDGINAAQNQYN